MRKSIATVSMSGTLSQKLEAISAAGFDGIELFENDFIGFKGSAADLRAMASGLGLSIDLYQPFRDFEGMPDALFQRSLDRAERKFDIMQELGVPLMLCCSNTSPAAIDDPARAAAQLHELAERAGRRSLKVGFEALAWGRHTRLYGQAWSIVKQADHPGLGLILDSFHTLSLGDDPSGIAAIPGDKIFFLQMADAPLLSMDVIQWARHHRNFPGQGQLDVDGFFMQVLRSGYQGPLSLEIFNDVFRESSNVRTAVDAMRSLLYLESRALERLKALPPQASGAEVARSVLTNTPLVDLPPAPALKGVSFIEFAVDESSAELLGELLQKMGFVRSGRHRSKAATLYQKGRAALILNTQPNSFARSRFGSFGSSVCAIGLCVDDPVGAVRRATLLRSVPFESPIGPGEASIPAVISPGGIVIHFIPESLGQAGLFKADFEANHASAADATLDAAWSIDHIAFSMNVDQRDTWVLFARAVLGLEHGAREQVADPFGLISSFGMSNAERTVRLALTVSQSQRTTAAKAANAQGGVAVHHISLACNDIFSAVKAWRAAGVSFVPISDNYYDDLPTRFDLEQALVDGLREHGILFDRMGSGSYFHIYTEDVSQRFFFELVQRVDGYDGYGVLNSAMKLASQAQGSAGR